MWAVKTVKVINVCLVDGVMAIGFGNDNVDVVAVVAVAVANCNYFDKYRMTDRRSYCYYYCYLILLASMQPYLDGN